MFGTLIAYGIVGFGVGLLLRVALARVMSIGLVLASLLGLIGAVVGGTVAAALGLATTASIAAGVAGAALLVLVLGLGRPRTGGPPAPVSRPGPAPSSARRAAR